MRRFHPHPNKSEDVEHKALLALLAAMVIILFELYLAGGETRWLVLAVPGFVLVSALYVFLRARFVAYLPVAEITDERLRWRMPDGAWYSTIDLRTVVTAHWSATGLVLVDRAGVSHPIPLPALHFKEGSFAINILRAELDRIIAAHNLPARVRTGANG